MMKPLKRVEPTIVHKLGHRSVVTKHFVMPDGNVYDFQTFNVEGMHCAGVVALTPDNQVITAYQYRTGPEKMMYEIPGGGVEPHETDFSVAAARELQEETGYVAGKMTHLGDVYKDAYNNATWHYYLAEDCTLHPDGQNLDEHEYVEVKLLSIEEYIFNAKNGLMTDTEAVFLAYDKLKALL